MEDHRDNDLNLIIEDALGSYSDANPPASLERRIMARVNREVVWWRLSRTHAAIAVAAALVLITVQVVRTSDPAATTPRLATEPTQQSAEKPILKSAAEIEPLPTRQARRIVHTRPPAETGRGLTVPTLTSEERALLALAELPSTEPGPEFIEQQQSGIRPLEVHAIEITPLQSDGSN